MRKKLDDVTWVLNQPVVSYTLKKHLLWCDTTELKPVYRKYMLQ